MAARLLAAMAAIALVVGAFVIRSSGDDGAPAFGGGSAALTLLCASDLADACRDIADATVRTEAAGVTADRLLDDGDLGADVWVTTSAWVALVEDERARLGRRPAIEAGDTLARSPVSLVIWDDRRAQLGELCPTVDWSCLAAQAGTALASGDRVQVGMPSVDSAAGLVVAVAQARSLTGRDDFAANDFSAGIRSQASALASGQQRDALTVMRTRGPGQLTAVGTLDAGAASLASTFGTIVSEPDTVTADVVAAWPVDARSLDSGAASDLAAALRTDGWKAADDPSLPSPSSLPSGSVIAAVRTIWSS